MGKLRAIDKKIMGQKGGGGAAAGKLAGMLLLQILLTVGKVLKVNV